MISKDLKLLKFFNIILLLFVLLTGKEAIGAVPDGFVNELVASGMTGPVGLTFLPDGRILVIEQRGTIRLVVNGALQPSPILDIQGQVRYSGEQGLLGIAVDPGYPARPFIYLYYTHETLNYQYITRFTMTGTLTAPNGTDLIVDPDSYFYILTDIPRNAGNHNGGTLRFGIDGMLYAGPGDDAGVCVAQLRNDLRGVILRMDVSGLPLDNSVRDQAAKAEMVPADNPFASAVDDNERLVWAYGLRNPFRFSIDSATGNLFIGDVGAGTYEEVSLSVPPGGENFGWPYREGYGTYTSTCYGYPEPVDETVEPIGGYYQLGGSNSVMGGVVYHAVNFPNDLSWPAAFDGDYFFADYYQGFLIRLQDQGDGTWAVPPPVSGQPASEYFITELSSPSDFVMGTDGAIYYTSQWSNSVYRIGYLPTPYTLTVNKNGTGTGTVTSSPAGIDCGSDCTETYNAGAVVTLTANADAGSVFDGWSGGGCSGTGDCVVTMNADTTVTATFNACDISFSDVSCGHWAYDYIIAIYDAGITTGYGDGTYRPTNTVTRAEMAAFIIRAMEGEPAADYCGTTDPFPDVPYGDWACKYILRLVELGITTGYGDGTYRPTNTVNRAEMAAFIIRALYGETFSYSATPYFPDVADTHWAFKYIQEMYEDGITTGYGDGTYVPTNTVNRAEMAAFLARAFLGIP